MWWFVGGCWVVCCLCFVNEFPFKKKKKGKMGTYVTIACKGFSLGGLLWVTSNHWQQIILISEIPTFGNTIFKQMPRDWRVVSGWMWKRKLSEQFYLVSCSYFFSSFVTAVLLQKSYFSGGYFLIRENLNPIMALHPQALIKGKVSLHGIGFWKINSEWVPSMDEVRFEWYEVHNSIWVIYL